MKPRYYILLSLLATLVAYQSWLRFEYLIGLNPDMEEHYQTAWTSLWSLCMALAWALITKGVMAYANGKRGDYHVAEFFFGLAVTNVFDELFFNPLEIVWAEYVGMGIAAYIALTNYGNVAPVETGFKWILKHIKKLWPRRWNRTT